MVSTLILSYFFKTLPDVKGSDGGKKIYFPYFARPGGGWEGRTNIKLWDNYLDN